LSLDIVGEYRLFVFGFEYGVVLLKLPVLYLDITTFSYVPNDRQWVKGTPALGWYLTGVSPHGSLESQPDVPVPLLVSD
jgi:hypothetical protein